MTTTYKVLGQLATAAATEANVYVVPAGNSAVISSLTICNQSATTTTYRILVKVANAATTSKQYLVYDAVAPGNDTVFLTLGLTLAAGDVLAANTAAATCSINAFGSEIY
jgi:hypothetical protein